MSNKMRMHVLVAALLLFFCAGAQNFDVPKDYNLKHKSDFKNYEPDVVKTVDWLEATPLDWSKQKHAEAYKFLLDWVSRAPNVSVDVDAGMLSNVKENAPLMIYYMGGWARYDLTHNEKHNKLQSCMAGLHLMLNAYTRGKDQGLKPDKKLESLVAMDKSGELEKWAAQKISKRKK